MKKNQYNKEFELYVGKPWLLNKKDSLSAILGLCKSNEERDLVCDLLKRFSYIDSEVFSTFLENMVDQAMIGWGLNAANTQIVATAINEEADSSQKILQLLKPLLSKKGWEPRQINNITKAREYVEERPHIVLVDEFVGTGRTISNRVRYLRRIISEYKASNKKNLPCQIFVCVAAGMSKSREIIEGEGVEYHMVLELERGISDYYPTADVNSAIQRMLRIESELDQVNLPNNYSEFPTLGWGKAEALYAAQGGNIPNSVFPIFWWKNLLDNRANLTMFDRYE